MRRLGPSLVGSQIGAMLAPHSAATVNTIAVLHFGAVCTFAMHGSALLARSGQSIIIIIIVVVHARSRCAPPTTVHTHDALLAPPPRVARLHGNEGGGGDASRGKFERARRGDLLRHYPAGLAGRTAAAVMEGRRLPIQ